MKSPSSFKIGRILGKCQLLELLGRGGTGSVYVARHLFLRRLVAVKLLAWDLDWLEDDIAAFERGAIALARLNHPNIATIHDIDEEEGRPYVICEFVDGIDVDRWIRQNGPISPERAVIIGRAVARALDHAHAQGVLHRDIKPANILLAQGGGIKVIDFGMAEQVAHLRRRRGIGTATGTPYYVSPEQARGIEADGRSDLYSLGVSLYEMVTGRRPFEGRSASSVILKHLAGRRPDVDERVAGPLTPVVRRLLSIRPEERYAGAGEVARELDRLASSRGRFPFRRT